MTNFLFCYAQVPVFGQPGLILGQDSLTLNPAGHASLLVSADTAPSLPVYPTPYTLHSKP